MDLSLNQEAAEAARQSYSHARKVAFAALAAQHNASSGEDGPWPDCCHFPVVFSKFFRVSLSLDESYLQMLIVSIIDI